MRRYDIVSAILLILSIIDITLAAPVLVRKNRQASVDVVQIPKNVIDVLGKRVVVEGAENLAMVTLDYFKTMGRPVESLDAHASSSSAPPELDHGSTSVVQTPGPNPASSTTNPSPLKEPSSPSSIASSVKGVWGDTSLSSDRWSQSYEGNDELHDVALDTPASPEHGSDQELPATWANWHAQPKQNPRPSIDSQFDWSYMEDPLSPRPASPKGATEYQVGHVQQPNSGPPANSDFDWNYWMNLEDQAPSRLTTKLDSDPNLMVVHRPPTDTRLTTKLDSDPNLMAAYQPPTNSRLTTKLDSDPNLMAAYLPPTNSRLTTKLDSDPNLMAAHQLPTSSRLTTKPDSGPNLMAYQPPTDSRLTTKLDSDANLMAAHQPPLYPLSPTVFDKTHDASPSSPYASSSTRVDPYSYPGSVAHLPSPGAGLPTVPEGDKETLSSLGAEINSNHQTSLEGHLPVVPTRPAGNAAAQIESGQAHEDHVLQVLEPIPGSSADWKDIENPPPKKSSWKSLINWKYWGNPDPLTPKAKLALSKPSKSKPSTKSGVNWKYWVNPLNLMDPLTPEGRLRLASPRPLDTRPSSNTGPSNPGLSNPGSSNPLAGPSTPRPSNPGPSNPGSSNLGPSNPWPLNPRPLRIQEPKIDDTSSSTDLPAADSQSMDPQAALYAVKGKGKELRRASGAVRDVENAAQREFQPVEV